MSGSRSTAVLEMSGVQWATSKNVAEAVLTRRPGVLGVDANPVAQTATIAYDPERTSVAELAGWVRDCGYHCAGQSVPQHVCDPLLEPTASLDVHHHPREDDHDHHDHRQGMVVDVRQDRPPTDLHHDHHAAAAAPAASVHAGHAPLTSQEAMGHGGHHAGMSMDDMVRDMRNRFLVAVLCRFRSCCGHRSGATSSGSTLRPVRAARRHLLADPQPAGDLLLVLGLLRRRLEGAAGAHAGHDGSGCGGDRRRLALQPVRDAHRGRRGVLRGGDRPRRLRPAGPLVRDASPRWRERCHPNAARTGAADGGRAA